MIRLIAFDLDGVLVDGWGSWSAVHKGLGTYERARENANSFFRGEISFGQWADLDVSLWRGTNIAEIERILSEVPLMTGIHETLNYLKPRYKIAVISGGLKLMADRIARTFDLDHAIGNTLEVESGKVVGVGKEIEFDGKGRELERIAAAEGIDVEECAAVGDYLNDIPMFELAGYSVAFNPQDNRILEHADVVIRKKDLRNLLDYF